MSKHREATYWVHGRGGGTTQDVGPFIEEADARLARAALELYQPALEWTMGDKEPRPRR